jgi:hypothetical protein
MVILTDVDSFIMEIWIILINVSEEDLFVIKIAFLFFLRQY